MSVPTCKAAGWRFHSSRRPNGALLRFDGCEEAFDAHTLAHLCEQVSGVETEDVGVLLSVLPPVDQLVKAVPYSIPLLHLIYDKCQQIDPVNPDLCRLLYCEQLFCQLIWWTAYCEQAQNDQTGMRMAGVPSFESMESHVLSLMTSIHRWSPRLLARAHSDRRQLAVSLESLGCHGLVNCSKGLIRLQDAVTLELSRQYDKIKSANGKIKDTSEKGKSAADPSKCSHQRQMNLRLSEVLERLKSNELVEALLHDALTSNHLTSLLRIVRKRVASDRLLVGLYNAFSRAAPEDFCFEQIDPVIAKLIVIFNNAYEKILALIPVADSDSGYSAHSADTVSERATSPEHTTASKSGSNSSDSSLKAPPKSLDEAILGKVSLAIEDSKELKRARSCDQLQCEMHRFQHARPAVVDDSFRVQMHISRLKSELEAARERIGELEQEQERLRCPEPDYPNASAYYNTSSPADVDRLIECFGDLFHTSSQQVMEALERLDEFRASQELQRKTLLSVIVLTFRSVQESVQRRRCSVFVAIDDEDHSDDEETAALELAMYRYMYRRAKSEHGMSNAKEVTTKIWKTLYDFPSLKTCTRFNKFILECVDVCWDIVAGIDGRLPRLRIDYEGRTVDPARHCTFEGKGQAIRQFLWPGVSGPDGKVLLKALVVAEEGSRHSSRQSSRQGTR